MGNIFCYPKSEVTATTWTTYGTKAMRRGETIRYEQANGDCRVSLWDSCTGRFVRFLACGTSWKDVVGELARISTAK